jgi:hypothetical protein
LRESWRKWRHHTYRKLRESERKFGQHRRNGVRHGRKWRHKEGLEGVVEASGYIMEEMEGVVEEMEVTRRNLRYL